MPTKRAKLKAPYPYFGGKSRVAPLVWSRLGDCDNYIEPFVGSAAVLIGRQHPPRIETINDADCMVANFWRATKEDPEAVAAAADWPVNEADLHARHKWLVLSDEAKEFRRRMRTDPKYFDAKVAGWWCWGLCCWIGGGWCTELGVGQEGRFGHHSGSGEFGDGQGVNKGLGKIGERPEEWQQVCHMSDAGRGIHAPAGLSPGRKPRIDGGKQHGHGIHGKMPRLTGGRKGDEYYGGLGVHAETDGPNEQLPSMGARFGQADLPGVLNPIADKQSRPQLADAFSRGRGVNGNDAAGTCEQRLTWLTDWFGRLRDRLRTVRVCCGDWRRVCDSDSVTVRLGTTGIFFDPPYGTAAGRDMNLYAVDCGKVAGDVRAYCLERGGDKRYRIALAGYAGEGHEVLEAAGWDVVEWQAQGGYGNRSKKGRANAKKERLWFSPHCERSERVDLFAGVKS